jgi:small acid-soluble spore protein H (minor)
MNVTRAKEIVQSADKITVTYQGEPVWIDGVDEQTATARVHAENNPTDSKTVAVDQLVEQ